MTSQELRNTYLATYNTILRKQAAEHQVQQAEMKAKNAKLEAKVASLENELITSEVAYTTAKAKMEANPTQMKFVAVDATLHARAKLMEKFQARQHVDWDLDFKIEVWKDKEAELARGDGEGKTAEEPLSPRVES